MFETISRETKHDLLYRQREKDGILGEPSVLLQTRFDEGAPGVSPDGRFIAYVSDETGGNEVYVRTFPNGEGKWRVSTYDGAAPSVIESEPVLPSSSSPRAAGRSPPANS